MVKIQLFRGQWNGWALLGLLLLSRPVMAGVPVVGDILVTDVTDRSFSVVWTSSEASTGSLHVFEGSLCTSPAGGIEISAYPLMETDPARQSALRSAATAQGLLRVQVTGLTPGSEYCVQTVTTSTQTADVTVSPATPIGINTQIETTRLRAPVSGTGLALSANDILAYGASLPAPPTGLRAEIVAVSVVDASGQPVSNVITGVVGDAITQPVALLELNNLFGSTSRQTANLSGGERLQVLDYRGLAGCRLERFRKVPADAELAQIKSPAPCFDNADIDCNDRVNILDVLRVVGGFGRQSNDFCFNPDWDVVLSGNINILDVLNVVGKFGLTPS